MIFTNDKISLRQLQTLIILDAFSTGMIIFPRRLTLYANQDGYIVMLIATLIAIFYMYIIMSVGKLFPNDSFVTYTKQILTKPISYIVTLGFVLKIIINLTSELRLYSEVINDTLLFKTPIIVISISMLLVSIYCASKGIEARARVSEILIILVLLFITLVIAMISFKSDFSNLKPFLNTPPKDLALGSIKSIGAFIGIEYGLLIYPYLRDKKNARRASMIAVFFHGIVFTIITILCITKFEYLTLQRQLYPVLELINTIELPGTFIERQDSFVISFWIIGVFTTISAGLFFACILLKDLFKKGSHLFYICICALIILFLSTTTDSIAEVFFTIEFISLALNLFYSLILPITIILIAKLRKVGVQYE